MKRTTLVTFGKGIRKCNLISDKEPNTFEEFVQVAFDSNTDQESAVHYQFHILDARKWAFVRKTPIEEARFYIDKRTGYCRVEVDENSGE